MRIQATKPLFAWGILLLTILLRHNTFEACLAELGRNEQLRRLIGIESEQKVPKKWNVSRFLNVLGQEPHLTEVKNIFNTPAGAARNTRTTLAYDKAADDHQVHALLHRAKIRPLIQNRALWKEEPERMLPGHDGRSNIVHEGWTCPSEALCNAGKKYGKTVRVDRTIDLRRFPPIPRATKKFERLYHGRTAVMIVHIGLATLLASAPRWEGTLGKTRLGPIQKALRQPQPA